MPHYWYGADAKRFSEAQRTRALQQAVVWCMEQPGASAHGFVLTVPVAGDSTLVLLDTQQQPDDTQTRRFVTDEISQLRQLQLSAASVVRVIITSAPAAQ
jgi:hypothetical protein